MSIFTKILEKLGIKKGAPASSSAPGTSGAKQGPPAPAPAPLPPPTSRPGTTAPSSPPTGSRTGSAPATGTAAPAQGPRAISEVDVVKQLEERAKGSGLDWKVSIVDLLKLLDIDSSREARNELAKELGAPANVMTDSARMNTWLHKEVLRRIAENGGNIPQNLLD